MRLQTPLPKAPSRISSYLFPIAGKIHTTCMLTWRYSCGLLEFNTFTAVDDLSRFNSSCLKLPTSTLVDLIFQRRCFISNQLLTCNYRRKTNTAAVLMLSLSLLEFIMLTLRHNETVFVFMLRESVGYLWLQPMKNFSCVKSCMCDKLYFSVQHGIQENKNNWI